MIPQFWQDRFREYQATIEKASADHGIPTAIICGIISQESGWDSWAIRYEPDFTKRYIIPAYPKSTPTFQVQYGSSWGLMQLMGLVARELGYKDNILYLLRPEIGIEWGCRKLAALAKRYGVGKDTISSYNQGNPRKNPDGSYLNQDYVTAVLSFADEFGKLIPGL